MTNTHAKGLPEHRGVTSGQAMSAAARRRACCHAALPLTAAQGRWAKLRGRMKKAHELLASRLQRVLAGIDAWLLQSPLWFMCVGLGLLGELCHWLLWLYMRRYYPVIIHAHNKLDRPKLRKVRVPTWFQLQKRSGPWRQACQQCLCDTIVEKARMVGPQRICGIKGARGLGNCFRAARLKSVGCQDNARIRKCVFLIQHRWNIHVPRAREIAVQSAAKSPCPQTVEAKESQSTPPAGHGGQFGNKVLQVVKESLDKWNSRSEGMDEDFQTSNREPLMNKAKNKTTLDCCSGLGISGAVCLWGPMSRTEEDKRSETASVLPAEGRFPKPQHVQPATPPKCRFQTQKETHPTHEVPDAQMDDELESNGKVEEDIVDDDGHDQNKERPRSQGPARVKPKTLEFKEATETAKRNGTKLPTSSTTKDLKKLILGETGAVDSEPLDVLWIISKTPPKSGRRNNVNALAPSCEVRSRTLSTQVESGDPASTAQVECLRWSQAHAWLQTIARGVPDHDLSQDSPGALQSCLLACSAITRAVNAAMEKVSDPEFVPTELNAEEDTKSLEIPDELSPRKIAQKRTKQTPKNEAEKRAWFEKFSFLATKGELVDGSAPLETYKEFDVVCVQEANMSDDETKVLAAAAWKSGWVAFALPNKCCRGMITLVGKHLKSRIAHKIDASEGQLLGVQVGYLWVGNVYCAHHPDRQAFMSEAFQLCLSWSPNAWTLVGDFNDTPADSPLAFGLYLFRLWLLFASSRD
eukprot:Skav229309  [mRNA]  locus=scaffold2942:312182:317175:- [translate_table: standard]